nr:MAG: nonstructural protein [Microvirus sp.]
MITNLYAVYDKVAKEAGPPFTAVNDGIAKRSFKQMNIPEQLLGDYELHMIGAYDTVTMDLIPEISYTLAEEDDNVR